MSSRTQPERTRRQLRNLLYRADPIGIVILSEAADSHCESAAKSKDPAPASSGTNTREEFPRCCFRRGMRRPQRPRFRQRAEGSPLQDISCGISQPRFAVRVGISTSLIPCTVAPPFSRSLREGGTLIFCESSTPNSSTYLVCVCHSENLRTEMRHVLRCSIRVNPRKSAAKKFLHSAVCQALNFFLPLTHSLQSRFPSRLAQTFPLKLLK
jgi:hypothetical protein